MNNILFDFCSQNLQSEIHFAYSIFIKKESRISPEFLCYALYC